MGALSEIDYGKYYDYASVGIEHLDHPALYTGTESPHNGQRDSATVILGASWKTPTRQQLNELFRSTTVAWVGNYNGSGVDGVTCTGKNGNSIFIPAAGAYHAIHD